jgi:septal ring factor EnvC (AmiA/AmiB activator)
MNPLRPTNRRIHIALIVALALPLLIPIPGAAQDSLEAQKRRELETIQRAAQEKRDAARRLLRRETAEISQLRRTERRLNSTRERLRTLDRRQRTLGQELQVTHVSLVRSEQALRLQKDKLSRRLRNLYKYGGERPLEFLLSTQSFAQLLARWDFLVMVAEQDRMLIEDVLATKATVEQTQSRLENRIDEIGRNTKKTNRETQQLSSLRTERSKSVKAIQGQRQEYEAAAAELERTAVSLKRLLAELERRRREETDRARAQGRSPEVYTGDFARGEGRLEWPVRGSLVGHFGTEVHPKWGTVVMNNGIDIATPVGTPVHVVSRGRVDYVSQDFGTYGQMVVVNHGDGYYTLYGHLSTISVSSGAQVATGQLIGYSGDTGSLKGAVLHFEVRKGAQSLDPEKWLR